MSSFRALLWLLLALFAASACKPYAQVKSQISQAFSGNSSKVESTKWEHVQYSGVTRSSIELTGTCTIPVHEDAALGFSVGKPGGWHVDDATGTVVVTKDQKKLTGALVFPARVRNDFPPERLATLFAKALATKIEESGGSLELSDAKTDGSIATAVLLATVDGTKLRGPLEVVAKPGFMTLKLYWAPEADFAKAEPTLKQIVTCFKRKTRITAKTPPASAGGASARGKGARHAKTQALKPYRGRYFSMSMPAGWKVQDDMQNGIDVYAENGSGAVGFGWSIGADDPAQSVQRLLAQYYQGVRVIQSGFVQSPRGWRVFAAEWEGPVKGRATHGIVRAAVGQGVSLSSVWQAPTDKWAASRATLESMVASVQILPAAVAQVRADLQQQLASYPPVAAPAAESGAVASGSDDLMAGWQERSEAQDRQHLAFDDAIRGQDRAISPTTGEQYVCPNTAWSDSGPDGAGYYRELPGGGAELLEVQQPSDPEY